MYEILNGAGVAAGISTVTLPTRFYYGGNLYVDTTIQKLIAEQSGTISEIRLELETTSAGADVKIDINVNGSSILSSALTISAGANSASTTSIASPSIVKGDKISWDIDQIGSTIPGAKLSILIIYST
jgi:hypothetical protein